mgnify:FL=1
MSFGKESRLFGLPSRGEISVAVVGEKKMAQINEIYRRQIGPTDVLSFAYLKDRGFLDGELVFCPTVIEKRAKASGVSFQTEWRRDFVHGMLHLLGWEHGKKMFDQQEKCLEFLARKKQK